MANDDPEAEEAIDRVIDALGDRYTPRQWLGAAIAIAGAALGNMENRDLVRLLFDRRVTEQTQWFADSFRRDAMLKKALN
jgi:hypothetical protein